MTSPATTRVLTLCAALMLLPALAPANALAASAYKSYGKLVVSASGGERNNVNVSVSGNTFTVTDTGAPLGSTGPGCSSAGSNTVTCTNGGAGGSISYLWVSAGDADDAVTITSAIPAWIDGGSGNDHLVAGGSQDWLFGNSGDDTIGGGGGADSLSGGDGVDTVDYSTRTAAVTVTLDDRSGDGEANESDNVRASVENVLGGSGSDSLTGSAANNALTGGPGDDGLTAAGGDDTIEGGSGADTIDGGEGADVLRARDGFGDRVSCGAGIDSIDFDSIDVLAGDCEVPVAQPGPADTGGTLDLLPSSLRLSSRGTVSVPVTCPARFGGTCRGMITLTAGSQAAVSSSRRKALARKKFKVRAGQTKVLKVRISRNGRRRVLLKNRLKCKASAVTQGADGRSSTATKSITIKAPKGRGK